MKNHFLFILLSVLLLASCKKENEVIFTPPPPSEHAVITSVKLTFFDNEGGENVEWMFSDPDGDGGNPPVVTVQPLLANRNYTLLITLYNELEDPVLDVTPEIQDEEDDHQFFFLIDSELDITISYEDVDSNGYPIGLINEVETGLASSGEFRVVLKHFPNKTAPNVANGDMTNAGGGTDADVTFQATIQ